MSKIYYEEEFIKIKKAGFYNTYYAMIIEDEEHQYIVIDEHDAKVSPVNATGDIMRQNHYSPDFWVYVDKDMTIENAETANFSTAPKHIIEFYQKNRTKPFFVQEEPSEVKYSTVFDPQTGQHHDSIEINVRGTTYEFLIDKEWKGIYVNGLNNSDVQSEIQNIGSIMMNYNLDYFDHVAGEQLLIDIARAQNPWTVLHAFHGLSSDYLKLSAQMNTPLVWFKTSNKDAEEFLFL